MPNPNSPDIVVNNLPQESNDIVFNTNENSPSPSPSPSKNEFKLNPNELLAIGPNGKYTVPKDDKESIDTFLSNGPQYHIVTQLGPEPEDYSPDKKYIYVKDKETGEKYGVPVEEWDPKSDSRFVLRSVDNHRNKNAMRTSEMESFIEVPGEKPRPLEAASRAINAIAKDDPERDKKIIEAINRTGKGLDVGKNSDIQTPDGKYKMQIYHPDGSISKFYIDAKDVSSALISGAEFQDEKFQAFTEAQKEQNIAKKVLPQKNGSFIQFDKPGFEAVANTLTYGLINEANKNHLESSKIRPETKAEILGKMWAYNEDPEIQSHIKAGEIGGFLLSLTNPGSLGFNTLSKGARVLTKTLLAETKLAAAFPKIASIAIPAISHAAAGATLVAPEAVAQGIYEKNPLTTVEHLAFGAGIGAVLGTGVEKGAKIFQDSAIITKFDNALLATGQSVEQVAKIPKAQKIEFLQALSDQGVKASSNDEKIINVFEKLSSGEHTEAVLTKLDKAADKTTVGQLTSKIEGIGKEVVPENQLTSFHNPIEQPTNNLMKEINNLANKNGELSLSSLQQLSSKINKILPGVEDKTSKLFLERVNTSIKNNIIELGDQASKNSELIGPVVVKQWSNAKGIQNLAEAFKTMDLSAKAAELPAKFSPATNIIKSVLSGGLGIIGAAAGHSIAPGFGSLVGHQIMTPIKNKLLDAIIGNPETPGFLAQALNKTAKSGEDIGSYMVIGAAHAGSQKIAEIPTFIKNIMNKGAEQVFLNKNKENFDNEKFQQISKQLSLLTSNNDLRQQHLNELVQPLEKNHPVLAQQLKQAYENKIQYLHQIMPKDSSPPQPFIKKENWQPSSSDLKEFSEHIAIANNPYALLAKLKDGSITSKQVATAAMLNPSILQEIRNQIAMVAYSGQKIDMTYQQKLSTSLLMGNNMDASLNNIQQLQSVYGPSQQASAPIPEPKKHKGGSKINSDKLPAAKGTMAQRISQ